MQDFMRTGVFSAWDAYSALRAFEGGFAAITEEILRKERDWGPYVPDYGSINTRFSPRQYYWMATHLPGTMRQTNKNADLEISLGYMDGRPRLYGAWTKDRELELNPPSLHHFDGLKTEKANYFSGGLIVLYSPESAGATDFDAIYEAILMALIGMLPEHS